MFWHKKGQRVPGGHLKWFLMKKNFNITYPICDRIFGTLDREDIKGGGV